MDRPSRTAEAMALFRALESLLPPDRRLFDDPYAFHLLPPGLRALALAARVGPLGAVVRAMLDAAWPGARTAGVARTRHIDEALTCAVRDGLDQVVLLGAGFDSRAHRLPELGQARVYEVDRAATLRAKRARLGERRLPRPGRLVYVEADLSLRPVLEVLAGAGFDETRRAVFVWEGVTNYLDEASVDATLRAIASCAEGSLVIFTYVHREALAGGTAFPGARGIRRTVQRMGEAWTWGLDPADLPGALLSLGLALEEDVGIPECRARYWGASGARLRGYEFYRVARARVSPPAGRAAVPPGGRDAQG